MNVSSSLSSPKESSLSSSSQNNYTSQVPVANAIVILPNDNRDDLRLTDVSLSPSSSLPVAEVLQQGQQQGQREGQGQDQHYVLEKAIVLSNGNNNDDSDKNKNENQKKNHCQRIITTNATTIEERGPVSCCCLSIRSNIPSLEVIQALLRLLARHILVLVVLPTLLVLQFALVYGDKYLATDNDFDNNNNNKNNNNRDPSSFVGTNIPLTWPCELLLIVIPWNALVGFIYKIIFENCPYAPLVFLPEIMSTTVLGLVVVLETDMNGLLTALLFLILSTLLLSLAVLLVPVFVPRILSLDQQEQSSTMFFPTISSTSTRPLIGAWGWCWYHQQQHQCQNGDNDDQEKEQQQRQDQMEMALTTVIQTTFVQHLNMRRLHHQQQHQQQQSHQGREYKSHNNKEQDDPIEDQLHGHGHGHTVDQVDAHQDDQTDDDLVTIMLN